jgi:hypothetical protein
VVFPSVGFAVVACNLIVLALTVSTLSKGALAALLLWHGVFTGTVMGVVQVTVQVASGTARLGQASATVQFSRSIGAAFGTALAAFTLFAVLAIRNPEAAAAFARMVQQAGNTGSPHAGPQAGAMLADITAAFRAAFLLMAGFAAMGCVVSLSHPMRRI